MKGKMKDIEKEGKKGRISVIERITIAASGKKKKNPKTVSA